MVIIIFYSHIVPYKWWRIGVSLQSQSSYSPPCTTQCFIQQLFFSFVKKKARPQGRRIMERESGVFIRWSVFILLCDLIPSLCKKRSRASLSLLPPLFSELFPNLCSGPGRLSSHWTMRRHRHRCMHTHKNTHSHTASNTDTNAHIFTHTCIHRGNCPIWS